MTFWRRRRRMKAQITTTWCLTPKSEEEPTAKIEKSDTTLENVERIQQQEHQKDVAYSLLQMVSLRAKKTLQFFFRRRKNWIDTHTPIFVCELCCATKLHKMCHVKGFLHGEHN
mmetsp:Transcript_30832/g.45076  ORF Transcript_30832/g.45076 Transcript_30832/m.45076 type:complete len:114 (-) Transcript_30832:82-423(-)